ncbi:MAG TPA: helix-turn-helix transcriptional regulator [Methanoregulaceae archaeon]|nr:MAG: helix-turn-helix protein [Deltaproteobacteria bacterium ADurb.Bin135]HPA08557.1 helix-turn-helix transcriptional regulator [Methanoregulaceae archaeon]
MTLRDLRKSKGLSLGKLAELAGLSQKTVSDLEKKPPQKPRMKTLGKVADALGITADDLQGIVYPPKKKRGRGEQLEMPGEGSIFMTDVHVNRILRLIDNELEGLSQTLLEGLELVDDYPSIGRYMNMVTEDVDLLLEIKGLLQR